MQIEMVDMRQEYAEEQRDQNGQYGRASHEGRTYHKTVKVLTDEGLNKAIKAIEERQNIPEFCKAASIEEIREGGYILVPSRYIKFQERDERHRAYVDIVADYNRVVAAKNALKLTVNETLAKSLATEGFSVIINRFDTLFSYMPDNYQFCTIITAVTGT